jgi:GTP pyrophosphokinase
MLMSKEQCQLLATITTAPYVAISTRLITKARKSSGNMFRHQQATRAILIDYGYVDSVLNKAAIVHDVIEDVEGFDSYDIISADEEGRAVYELVLEVTRIKGEPKSVFLNRIYQHGSMRAQILKCADRISNMQDLGYDTDIGFIEKYCNETESFIIPMAENVNKDMVTELKDLVISRRVIAETLRRFQKVVSQE